MGKKIKRIEFCVSESASFITKKYKFIDSQVLRDL